MDKCSKCNCECHESISKRATAMYKTTIEEKNKIENIREERSHRLYREKLANKINELTGLNVTADHKDDSWTEIKTDGIRFTLNKGRLSVIMKCTCGDYFDHEYEIKSMEDLGHVLNGGFSPTHHTHQYGPGRYDYYHVGTSSGTGSIW